MHAAGVIFVRDEGLFEPLKEIGDDVAKGEEVARIHFPETPHRAQVEVTSPHDGMVLCKRMLARLVACRNCSSNETSVRRLRLP